MLERIGLAVHPTRDIDEALSALREWAERNDVDVVQVKVDGEERRVAESGDPEDCDVLVAIGGDGTALAAGRTAAEADRPVLGVACGSMGILTSVMAGDVEAALDEFAAGDWRRIPVPALRIERDDGDTLYALNDLAIMRQGQQQVTASASVDGVLYARFVGDGLVVSTPVGTSAYTLAAGGPLLAPGADALVVTPLAPHGGSIPPLVVGERSKLDLEVTPGYGGARLEVDGTPIDAEPGALAIELNPDHVTVVGLEGRKPLFEVLRKRRLVMDSPRILAREEREADGD